MPPKVLKKSSTGVSNELYYEEQRASDEVIMLGLRLAALKKVYIDRMEASAEERKVQMELASRLREEEEKLCLATSERVDILTDCMRQYKVDERDAIIKITALDCFLNRLHEEKQKLLQDIDATEALYDEKIKRKRGELDVLQQRASEMEKEFGAMLSDIEQSVGCS